ERTAEKDRGAGPRRAEGGAGKKDSGALPAPVGARVPAWQLRGERAACLQSCLDESNYVPTSQRQGSTDRAAHSHPRERVNERRYGYRKIRVLLNGEGLKVDKYLPERICPEQGLPLPPAAQKATSSGGASPGALSSTGPNQVWSMDFCCGLV